jgi:hypothetical protein
VFIETEILEVIGMPRQKELLRIKSGGPGVKKNTKCISAIGNSLDVSTSNLKNKVNFAYDEYLR